MTSKWTGISAFLRDGNTYTANDEIELAQIEVLRLERKLLDLRGRVAEIVRGSYGTEDEAEELP